MALIERLGLVQKERNTVHQAAEASYTIFHDGRDAYLQIDTYGSADRQFRGKVSQSIQLNRDAAAELKRLLEQAFPGL